MTKRNRDLEFLYEIGTLRHVKRSWAQFLGYDVASISEHIFRMAWIALVLAKHEKVTDTGKILKMVLVHDITESRTGDPHYISRQYAQLNEELAIEDMLGGTPLHEEFTTLWKEYEARTSIESKIVKDADNLDVDFELKEYAGRDHELYTKWRPTRLAVFKRLYTKSARKLWKEIHASNKHDWHIQGRNRLLAGDWSPTKRRKGNDKKK